MSGGTVISVTMLPTCTLVQVEGGLEVESIRVIERRLTGEPVRIFVGDSVFWTDDLVYWTPWKSIDELNQHNVNVESDIELPRAPLIG